ncbi:hypothetical protein HMPREF1544_10174 [Mucor circinelloides 1006PhL]|uniref:Uncharacterized protein n=1 Tax=Mucor circinelloides f. circinelloides (strain 1006PhL) TaxID=1220926 RepID=S2JTJ2_MUCC1|nr:hypothetical protein HMPREF1544_10174 [Mucor circinelloides 1006PhL]
MYQNVQDFNEAEEEKQHPECRHTQPSTSIDIPASSKSKDLFYKQMSPQYQEFYSDILSFTSESSLLDAYPIDHPSNHSNSSTRDYVDPMNDPQFMAFLSSLSTNEQPTTPSPQGPSMLLVPDLNYQKGADAETEDVEGRESQDGMKKQTKRVKLIKKRASKSNTRLGQCEHPKHSLYRQEKYILSTHGVLPSDDLSSATSLQSIPRRGRPPKGSKSSEFVYSTSPIAAFADDDMVDASMSSLPTSHTSSSAITVPCYPMVELTVRPLPKRLEAVVGKSNIRVCLTCLKRSDMDPAYLQDAAYVGPQALARRKK